MIRSSDRIAALPQSGITATTRVALLRFPGLTGFKKAEPAFVLCVTLLSVVKSATRYAVEPRRKRQNSNHVNPVILSKKWLRLFCFMIMTVVAMTGAATAEQSTPTPNLLTNGSFEQKFVQGQPLGFRCAPIDSRTKAAGTFELSTDAYSGKYALLIKRSNKNSGYALWLKIPSIKTTMPPRKIAFVCRVKSPSTVGQLSGAYLTWQSFNPKWYGACKLLRAIDPDPYAGTWGKTALLLQQLPDTSLEHFRFLVNARNIGDSILIDDVACYDVTDWPKQAVSALMKREQDSVSVAVIDKIPYRKGNLLQNSSFELGLSCGWSIPGPTPPEQMRMIDSSAAYHGVLSLRLDFAAGEKLRLTGKFCPVRIHQTHTLSAWVRSSVSNAMVTIGFENGFVPQGSGPHSFATRKKINPGKWQRIQVSGVTRAGPENAYGVTITASGAIAGSVLVDSVQFEEGPARLYAPRRPLEAALLPYKTSGISLWDQSAQYKIRVVNHTTEAISAKLKIQTSDFEERLVNSVELKSRSFSAGVTVIERSEDSKTRGAQRLRLYIDEQEEAEDEITLTVVPPARYPAGNIASRFGQHVKLRPWELGIARQLGACWVRMHDVDFCLSWDQTEPEKGKWVWADSKIDFARKNGVEVLGVLGRTPGWLLEPDDNGKPARGGWIYPPDLKAWTNYVENVTRHYRGKVDIWEIWNEPYSFGVYDGTKYSALAKTAYAAAKRGNPDCEILGFCTHAAATAFNRDALAGGTMDACDVVSYHCYTRDGTDAYEREMAVRDVLGLPNTDKKLWMSEGMGGYTYSWHSMLVDAVNDQYSRKPGAPGFSAENAAITGVRAIANILVAGAEKTFWYWSPWESASSIRPDRYSWFEYDGQLKPHAAAYAVAAHFLDGSQPVERMVIDDKLVVCLFEQGDKVVAVLWREDDKQSSISLSSLLGKSGTLLQVFDLMGNSLRLKEGTVSVNSHPLYIQLSGCKSSELINSLFLYTICE
ncbi:MAG: hypothetical protein PF904_15520 [Kiritimatiellae bacterium]|jgi:hypothetical protein|nr:hypothetical protein [Kiritimatiellia bacterium]